MDRFRYPHYINWHKYCNSYHQLPIIHIRSSIGGIFIMPLASKIIGKGIIQPRYILAIATVLMVVLVGMGLYELSASNKDVMSVLQEEAMSLAEAISIMGNNSLIFFDKTTELLIIKGIESARLLETLDFHNYISENDFRDIVKQNRIHQAVILNESGKIIYSSENDLDFDINEVISNEQFPLLLSGKENEAVINLYSVNGDSIFLGIHRRKGGIIGVIADANEILEFRKSIGIGRLMQEIGENEGIEYIVLQDDQGLVVASKNIKQMRKISGDSFLENALQKGISDTRIYSYNGKDVLEVVNPFPIDEKNYGLFRIGLSMKEAKAANIRSIQRLIIISLVALVVTLALLGFLLVNQNYSLLNKSYERIQSYTGAVLESIADGIIVADKNKNISVFNKSAGDILNVSAIDFAGKSISCLSHEIQKVFDDSYEADWSEHVLEIALKSNQRILSINISRTIKLDDILIIAVIRDVTEERVLEENIKRTEQLTAMGKLASAVAHEVRNPLNAISMTAQRLDREFNPKDNESGYHEMTQMIKSESLRINKIIEEFLKFARPPKLNLQAIDIEQLLNEIIPIIKPQAEHNHIIIQNNYLNLGLWSVDKEQMKQVMLNLLLNGIEAMPNGGELSIESWKEDNGLFIEITDTGNGIPDDILPRIFDLYFTTKDTGTGLGLSIVQRVVAEHGGWIKVVNRQRAGTSFKIYLPGEKI
mgnify:CR=1 FL=1